MGNLAFGIRGCPKRTVPSCFKWGLVLASIISLFGAPSQAAPHLHDLISDHIQPQHNNVSVSYIDLLSNRKLHLGFSEAVNPASTIKLPILVETYRQLQNNTISPTDTITVKKNDVLRGSGILKHKKTGKSYTIVELARYMIIHSDNTATKLLAQKLGIQKINETCTKLGLTKTQMKTTNLLKANGKNFSHPSDLSNLLQLIVQGSLFDPAANIDILSILADQKYRWGIPKHIETKVRVANKTGSLLGIKNDCAVVFHPDRPYILTIFTRNFSSEAAAKNYIATLSKKIYNWHNLSAKH